MGRQKVEKMMRIYSGVCAFYWTRHFLLRRLVSYCCYLFPTIEETYLIREYFSVACQMANQARWSVMQSYNLLKWHKKAHRAAVKALEDGHSLGTVIRRIEEAIGSDR
jgi:hypothetical protein